MSTHNTTIDHVIIAVSDLARASKDYALLLGRGPSWQGRHPDYGTANTLFRLDNTYIELLAAQGSGIGAEAVAATLQSKQNALGGLVFGTEDSSEFLAQARNAGLAASDPAPSHGVDELSGNTRRWSNLFWDPAAARGIFSFCICHEAESYLPPAPISALAPISAVDHVVVQTRDADAAKRFYGEQLGIRLALEQEVPQWGGTQLFFRASSMSIEVIASEKSEAMDNLWGLALKTADIDATQQRLNEAGIEVSEVRDGRKKGTRVCTVKSHALNVPTLLIEHPLK
ncbi:MAG: VOC family protein [Luminiphilus sp.]|nr:VOC family protein [Luminiphilus sp.]